MPNLDFLVLKNLVSSAVDDTSIDDMLEIILILIRTISKPLIHIHIASSKMLKSLHWCVLEGKYLGCKPLGEEIFGEEIIREKGFKILTWNRSIIKLH